MGKPVTTTTEQDDVILRFLRAAEARTIEEPGRIPLNGKEARAAISWLRGLVGRINEDGTLEDRR